MDKICNRNSKHCHRISRLYEHQRFSCRAFTMPRRIIQSICKNFNNSDITALIDVPCTFWNKLMDTRFCAFWTLSLVCDTHFDTLTIGLHLICKVVHHYQLLSSTITKYFKSSCLTKCPHVTNNLSHKLTMSFHLCRKSQNLISQ
jgi:hypothetical protein